MDIKLCTRNTVILRTAEIGENVLCGYHTLDKRHGDFKVSRGSVKFFFSIFH